MIFDDKLQPTNHMLTKLITPLFHFVFLIAVLSSCSNNEEKQKPITAAAEDIKTITISSGDIKAVFIDNSAYGDHHKSGYNGISELRHTAQDSNLFVPFYAGFNLEHIFAGDSLIDLFEPRNFPMELKQTSDSSVVLYQAATPLSHVESWTTFKVLSPNYIDVHFRCIIKSDEFFKHAYAGFFWASYINGPKDKKIYFSGQEQGEVGAKWIGAVPENHGDAGTHLGLNDTLDIFTVPEFNVTLASNYSNYVFNEPFYYGRFDNMVFAYLFSKPTDGLIRFSQSPDGGGAPNPAWDFQFIIPDFEVGKEYTFTARMVYKEWKDAEDIRAEYENWRK